MTMGLNVDPDQWDEMNIRIDNPRYSDCVDDNPTPMNKLTEGDVVVLDVGKKTGPRSKRRKPHFNKIAYRTEPPDNWKQTCKFNPCDGRAAELTAKRGDWLRGSRSFEIWAIGRVSADALAHRVLDTHE